MTTVLLIAACVQDTPALLAVNGQAVEADAPVELAGTLGQVVDLELEVAGRPETRAWSVGAPPGWQVDPYTHGGSWMPEADATTDFTLLLEDDRERRAVYPVVLNVFGPEAAGRVGADPLPARVNH